MKKTNSMNKLAFGKATVTELNDQKLIDVKGGSLPSWMISTLVCDDLSKDNYAIQ